MSALPPKATAKADIRKRSCLLYPRKRTVRCTNRFPLWAKSGHVGVGTNYQNPGQKNQDQVNLYDIAGLTNIFYKTYRRVPKRLRPDTSLPGIVNTKTQEPNDQTSHPHSHPQNRGGSRCWHRLRCPNLKAFV